MRPALLRRWVVCTAVGATAAAIATAAIAGRSSVWLWLWGLGLPALAAWTAYVIAGIARLRLVGFLPTNARTDDFIPAALQPWIRFWLVTRFGLLWAMLFLVITTIAAAIIHRAFNLVAFALVYVVGVRILMDGAFGAALNIGVISRRRHPVS